jgi:hypothetical protein
LLNRFKVSLLCFLYMTFVMWIVLIVITWKGRDINNSCFDDEIHYNALDTNEVCFHLGCNTLYLSRDVPSFRRIILPLSSDYYYYCYCYYCYYYNLLIYPEYGRSTLLRNVDNSGGSSLGCYTVQDNKFFGRFGGACCLHLQCNWNRFRRKYSALPFRRCHWPHSLQLSHIVFKPPPLLPVTATPPWTKVNFQDRGENTIFRNLGKWLCNNREDCRINNVRHKGLTTYVLRWQMPTKIDVTS